MLTTTRTSLAQMIQSLERINTAILIGDPYFCSSLPASRQPITGFMLLSGLARSTFGDLFPRPCRVWSAPLNHCRLSPIVEFGGRGRSASGVSAGVTQCNVGKQGSRSHSQTTPNFEPKRGGLKQETFLLRTWNAAHVHQSQSH